MINSYPQDSKLGFTALLFITVFFGVAMRLSVVGWGLVIYGIPMLIMVILHLVIHLYAISKIPKGSPWVMIISYLLFLLGLALQYEGGDNESSTVIYYFLKMHHVVLEWLNNSSFLGLSLISWPLLIISWGILLYLARSGQPNPPNTNA